MTSDTESTTVEPLPVDVSPAAEAIPPAVGHSRAIETVVILLLAVLPDIFRAASSLVIDRSTGAIPFLYTAAAGLVRSLQVAGPVLYILWRSRERWSEFGFARFRVLRDVPLALLAIVMAYVAMIAFTWGLYGLFPDVYRALYSADVRTGSVYSGPHGVPEYFVLILMSAANGFTEELVMRGYLIRRFEQATKSTAVAVIASSVLFASYHIYYGTLGTLNILMTGLVFGAVYARYRRLWPLALAHAIGDIYGFARIG